MKQPPKSKNESYVNGSITEIDRDMQKIKKNVKIEIWKEKKNFEQNST